MRWQIEHDWLMFLSIVGPREIKGLSEEGVEGL
jgi:hypothetical protein